MKNPFSPYREPPKQESLPPPDELPNKIDRTFFNIETKFTFADGRAFDVSFEHDRIPEEWVDGGTYYLVEAPPHVSGESRMDSYVQAAHSKGFFTFSKDGKLHVMPWDDFKEAVAQTASSKKVNVTWAWKRNK